MSNDRIAYRGHEASEPRNVPANRAKCPECAELAPAFSEMEQDRSMAGAGSGGWHALGEAKAPASRTHSKRFAKLPPPWVSRKVLISKSQIVGLLTSARALTALLAAALIAFLPGCKPAQSAVPQKKEAAAVTVRVTEATRGEIIRYITLPAQVAANQQVTLYSKVGGYLKHITVDRGDEIAQGDLIAEIEVPELQADLGRCKAELEIAALDYKRAGDAHQRAPDLIVRQSVDAAKAKFDMAKANLDRIETLLSFCKISAPFSGVIITRTVDPGAFIPAATSGSAAQSAAVVTLSDFSTVRVQVAVPEPEVPLIKRGLPVKVTIKELPGQVFEGTITRFSQALDNASKTMLAEIDFKNPERHLRPGMFASVQIGVETRADKVLLPEAAVLFERSGTAIFTVAESKARKVPVKTGFQDGAFVEILDGMQPGDRAILVGKMALANGQAVNVEEGK